VGEDGEPDGTQRRQIMDERDTQGHWIPARPVLHLRPIAASSSITMEALAKAGWRIPFSYVF